MGGSRLTHVSANYQPDETQRRNEAAKVFCRSSHLRAPVKAVPISALFPPKGVPGLVRSHCTGSLRSHLLRTTVPGWFQAGTDLELDQTEVRTKNQ